MFLGSAVLIIASFIIMGLTTMYKLPSVLAMLAVATMQFSHSAGYVSVAGLLLGVLLPSGSRSTYSGLVAAIEGLSAFSQSATRPYIEDTLGVSWLYFIFAFVVTCCLIFMLFMMPETKGKTLEEIELTVMLPRREGCNIRRDSAETIKTMVSHSP